MSFGMYYVDALLSLSPSARDTQNAASAQIRLLSACPCLEAHLQLHQGWSQIRKGYQH